MTHGEAMLDADLIPLLRCPATKQSLRLATEAEKQAQNLPADEPALITADGSRIYRVASELPVLLSANDVAVTG